MWKMSWQDVKLLGETIDQPSVKLKKNLQDGFALQYNLYSTSRVNNVEIYR